MKPSVPAPIDIRGRKFGGSEPLFCIPLVAADPAELVAQAEIARALRPDLVEWRADFSKDLSSDGLVEAGQKLRAALPEEPIIFTLRRKTEGGAQEMPQAARRASIQAVLRSKTVDVVDFELDNEPEFLEPLMRVARSQDIRIILAFHDFQATGANADLLAKISAMHEAGADIAKIAVMPQCAQDVLRLFEVIVAARRSFPELPLCIMSMGALGSITRVAGFLYGSDMAFAVGKQASAPGQIPIQDARMLAETLLRYS